MNKKAVIKRHEFGMEYFRLIAETLPGKTTLNQIRVIQYIDLCSARNKHVPCHKEIAAALNLSTATVSRALAVFVETKIISSVEDRDDHRKRYFSTNKNHPDAGVLDTKVRQLIVNYYSSD